VKRENHLLFSIYDLLFMIAKQVVVLTEFRHLVKDYLETTLLII